MKSFKRIVLTISICLLFALSSHANENFPKTGVINIKKIAQTYFKNSKALRDLEAEKERNSIYIEKMMTEIKELDAKILDAKMSKDDDLAYKYQIEKDKKVEHLREYKKITTQQLDDRMKKLYYSDEFMNELLDTINKVALIKGFSLILDINAGNVYYYTPEVDITDAVIEALMKSK